MVALGAMLMSGATATVGLMVDLLSDEDVAARCQAAGAAGGGIAIGIVGRIVVGAESRAMSLLELPPVPVPARVRT